MALVETVHLAHVPPSITLFGALYQDVKNAAFLREQLLAGNSDFEYAFIDATGILSSIHILAAAFRAINDLLNDRLRSRNVHSEVVFNLSPNNNIASSLSNHGITPTTTSLLILKVSQAPTSTTIFASLTDHLTAHVDGTPVPFTDASLARMTNMSLVRKLYKLDNKAEAKGNRRNRDKAGNERTKVGAGAVSGTGMVPDMDRSEMEILVLGMMALKGS